ncbi:MAG: hypothetical protein HEP71_23760 [Roseivirga sp.]|nr:hypothetical protein [Roseivirga sp.]
MRLLNPCFCLALILLASCDNAYDDERDLLKGRTPEAFMLVSGMEWEVSNIGIVIIDNDSVGLVNIEILSPGSDSAGQLVAIDISDRANDRQLFSTYDFFETTTPLKVSALIGPRYSGNNSWQSNSNESVGLEITSLEAEDGRTYASGRFFANVYNNSLFPRIQTVEGQFSNVWVFDDREERSGYFLQSQANRNND